MGRRGGRDAGRGKEEEGEKKEGKKREGEKSYLNRGVFTCVICKHVTHTRKNSLNPDSEVLHCRPLRKDYINNVT